MHGRRFITATTVATALVLAGGGAAQAAGTGETVLLGGLPLPAGAIAGGSSGFGAKGPEQPAVSENGRYVAFVAAADALSPDAQPDGFDVYRKDRLTGAVDLVSRASGAAGAGAAGDARNVRISDDGTHVAWVTADSLDGGDTDDGYDDVYVRDLTTGITLLATPGTSADVSDFDLSGDGATIAFATTERLVLADTNSFSDVYDRRLSGGVVSLVSVNAAKTAAGGAPSGKPAISGDGAWVAFDSTARDLIANFVSGGGRDVYVRDVAAETNYLVSNQAGSIRHGSNSFDSGQIAIAGSPGAAGSPPSLGNVHVAYATSATDVGSDDLSADASVYVRQLSRTSSVLVSRADGATGADADDDALVPTISDDARLVAFTSEATDLGGDSSGLDGAFVRDVTAQRTVRVSGAGSDGYLPAISGDGSLVAWAQDRGITADGDPDLAGVFVRPYATPPAALGTPELIGRPPGSAPFLAPAFEVASAETGQRTVSGDGRYVVFASLSARLPGGDGRTPQVYRRDTATGAIELVSRAGGADGAVGAGPSFSPSISADGSRVAFDSAASLDPADAATANDSDVYLRDLNAGTTTLVSRADGPGGAEGDAGSGLARISADGAHVAFYSEAGDFGAPAGGAHVFLRDVAGGRLQLVDRAGGPGGAAANSDADYGVPSADGRYVVFLSRANNLDPADPPPSLSEDVYVRDTLAQTTRLVSRRSGADGAKATSAGYPTISDDGRVVAMTTQDQTLAPEAGPWGGTPKVITRDLSTDVNTLVSRARGGAPSDQASDEPSLNADGSVVAFESAASNLLPGHDGDKQESVYVRSADGTISGPPAFGVEGNDNGTGGAPSLSADGGCVVFDANGHNVATGPAGDFSTLYMYVVSGSCPMPATRLGGPPPSGIPPVRAVDPPHGTVVRPTLRASLKPASFRVGPKATAVTAAARRGKAKGRGRRARRTPVGTSFRIVLGAPATVTIAFERSAAGRKVGRGCRRPTRKLRRRKACVRWVAVRPSLKRGGLATGTHSVAFSGRLGRRALAPGSYRATLTATNAAGRSKPVTLRFTVVGVARTTGFRRGVHRVCARRCAGAPALRGSGR